MEFSGKIIAILPVKNGVAKSTGNEWKAQEYVIETQDQYPKKMCFEVFGSEKIDQFAIQMGEELNVSFDIDARQWQDRWFNSVRAWKVDRVPAGANAGADASASAGASAPVPPPPPTAAPQFTPGDAKDDLPF